MFKLKKITAFTLAETLMVIGILGIVSAITIPNLKNDTNYQVNMSKAKKTYAELSTAWDRAMLKDSIVNGSNLGAADVSAKLKKYLKVKTTGASYSPYPYTNSLYTTLCQNTAAILSDGSTFCVIKEPNSSIPFFTVIFDVDGPLKGANVAGDDVFWTSIAFNSGMVNPPVLDPIGFATVSGNTPYDLTTVLSTNFSASLSAMYWILMNDNMEYLKCTVQWNTKTTCK